jgi:hypothetical protein
LNFLIYNFQIDHKNGEWPQIQDKM